MPEHTDTKEISSKFEKSAVPGIDDLKKALSSFGARCSNIKTIILFGSFARGTQTCRSDIDLIVIMDTDLSFFRRYDGVHGDILRLLSPYAVEFFIYTPGEFDRMVSNGNRFIRRILKEGKVLYEH